MMLVVLAVAGSSLAVATAATAAKRGNRTRMTVTVLYGMGNSGEIVKVQPL